MQCYCRQHYTVFQWDTPNGAMRFASIAPYGFWGEAARMKGHVFAQSRVMNHLRAAEQRSRAREFGEDCLSPRALGLCEGEFRSRPAWRVAQQGHT